MKKYYLLVLFIGLMTIICPNFAQAQILKWILTDAEGTEVYAKASSVNANAVTDETNTLNTLRRGDGLNAAGLGSGFSSNSKFGFGNYAHALTNNHYFEFSVSVKSNQYLHCRTLNARMRRSSQNTTDHGVQWTYRIVDNGDLADINNEDYNTENPFKKIGDILQPATAGNGVATSVNIDVAELTNVPAGKTVFFRLYIWGFVNVNSSSFAIRTVSGAEALSLEGTVDGTLPVELKSFNAKSIAQGVQLAWQTVSETNNSHFDILKVSGQRTEKIGEVKGVGNSQATRNYEFLDTRPTAGINYYQLRQVDFNGDQSLSEIVTAKLEFDRNDLVVFTNGGQITINTYAVIKGMAEVVLHDMSGKTLLKKKVILNAGKNSFSFAVNLTKGTYTATVFSVENGKAAQKFIY